MQRWQPTDVFLALALAALGIAEVAVPFSTVMGSGSPVAAGAVATVAALALVFRRQFPLATLAVVMVPAAVLDLTVSMLVLFWGGLMPGTVATYSVARYGHGRQPALGAWLAAGSLLATSIGTGMISDPGELFFPWLVLTVAWVTGWAIHRNERRARASEAHARDVEATSRERTLAAVAEERAQIARELHDVVAHTVTAIVVQAGAARQVVDEDPSYVRDSLDRIRQTGSDALDEMRRAVALLRESQSDVPLTPQPRLDDLPALVEGATGATTRVQLRIHGTPRPVSAGADLAAYRIVQEALTNVHRHARATEVQVTLEYADQELILDVLDNGVGAAADHSTRGSRNGLVGMRERTAMYGGSLDAGPAPGSGYRVRAALPLGDPT